MFYASQNVFPRKEWTEIEVTFQKEAGRCICVEFREKDRASVYHIAVHFNIGDGVQFAKLFKDAVAKMEV